MSKPKGGRVTSPACRRRSQVNGHTLPHLWTSHRIVKDGDVVIDDTDLCSWCGAPSRRSTYRFGLGD